MRVMKCDRCGAIYEPYKDCFGNGVAFIHKSLLNQTFYEGERFDLCPSCFQSIATFLKGESHE